jgi:SAM-dependent methyltransferase
VVVEVAQWQGADVDEDYLTINQALWDERAPAHAASPDYGLRRFVDDPEHLSDVVRFDRERLGDLTGLRGVHLQCHLGTDTLSLARLGARMSGLDFSPEALARARELAAACGTEIEYVRADLYDAVEALGAAAFDLVYTGIGALGWLPDIRRWARVVAALLRPGGRLHLREGHPVLLSLADPRPDGLLALEYPYFEQPEGTVWDEDGTYVDTEASFTNTRSVEWNRGLGEVVTALLDAGLTLTALVEHDSVPWNALRGQMERVEGGEWRLADRPWRLPHTYTLQAVKG